MYVNLTAVVFEMFAFDIIGISCFTFLQNIESVNITGDIYMSHEFFENINENMLIFSKQRYYSPFS